MSEPREDLSAIRQHLADLPERLARVLTQLGNSAGLRQSRGPQSQGTDAGGGFLRDTRDVSLALGMIYPGAAKLGAMAHMLGELLPAIGRLGGSGPQLRAPEIGLRPGAADVLRGFSASTPALTASHLFNASPLPALRSAAGLPGSAAAAMPSASSAGATGPTADLTAGMREMIAELKKLRETLTRTNQEEAADGTSQAERNLGEPEPQSMWGSRDNPLLDEVMGMDPPTGKPEERRGDGSKPPAHVPSADAAKAGETGFETLLPLLQRMGSS